MFLDKEQYKGVKRRLAKKIAKKYGARRINFSLKEGGYIHDCDGFNHKIVDIEDEAVFTKRGWVIIERFYYKEAPFRSLVCTCSQDKTPKTPKEIEEWILSYDTPEGWDIIREWGFNDIPPLISLLREGKPIVDENGVRL